MLCLLLCCVAGCTSPSSPGLLIFLCVTSCTWTEPLRSKLSQAKQFTHLRRCAAIEQRQFTHLRRVKALRSAAHQAAACLCCCTDRASFFVRH